MIKIQRPCKNKNIPTTPKFKKWVEAAFKNKKSPAEITLRIVDNKESTFLNEMYRNKTGPTNVLTFAYDKCSGDIILCAPLIAKQAKEQGKPLALHWAHLVVHGCLHVLGYDHIKKADQKKMETLEVKILEELGFENPYK